MRHVGLGPAYQLCGLRQVNHDFFLYVIRQIPSFWNILYICRNVWQNAWGIENSGIDDSFLFYSWRGYKLSGIQKSRLGEAECINDNREHGVNLIENIWSLWWMMLTRRVKHIKLESSEDVWRSHTSEEGFKHLKPLDKKSHIATDGLHSSAGRLSRSHAFSWPLLCLLLNSFQASNQETEESEARF